MQSRARRYTDRSFPRYRFVPGRHPHPTAHPEGHSYGHEPQVRHIPPARWRESPDYLFGADLYNHGYWWEAHEAWEGLWQLCDKESTQGVFLKGLIQVSACHLQFLMQHPRGFERLRRTSAGYLVQVVDTAGPWFMGLELPAFLEAVQAYYCDRPLGGEHDPVAYPYVVLASERVA